MVICRWFNSSLVKPTPTAVLFSLMWNDDFSNVQWQNPSQRKWWSTGREAKRGYGNLLPWAVSKLDWTRSWFNFAFLSSLGHGPNWMGLEALSKLPYSMILYYEHLVFCDTFLRKKKRGMHYALTPVIIPKLIRISSIRSLLEFKNSWREFWKTALNAAWTSSPCTWMACIQHTGWTNGAAAFAMWHLMRRSTAWSLSKTQPELHPEMKFSDTH